MTTIPSASIVIPAHNEAGVISRCLEPLAPAIATNELQVVVACNGCTDSTADVARQTPGVRVLELDRPSKASALRAGDEVATTFPRVYLDADVAVTLTAIRCIVAFLESYAAPAARPPIKYAAEESSWLVRQYYAARTNVPSVMNSLWGAGIYALSRQGRERFDAFPDVIGDDLWIDDLFDASEIAIVDCDPVVVFVPRRSKDLFSILRRAQRGKRGSLRMARAQRTTSSVFRQLWALAGSGPRAAAQATVYAGFAAAARAARVAPAHGAWERDYSSRDEGRRPGSTTGRGGRPH